METALVQFVATIAQALVTLAIVGSALVVGWLVVRGATSK